MFGEAVTRKLLLGIPKMVSVSLTLSIPNRTWIGSVSREFPDARFRVHSAQSCGGLGIGVVELLSQNPGAVVREIRQYDAVRTIEVFLQEDDRALLQLEAENPILLRLLDRTGVPVQTPFVIADGRVNWELTTTQDRLSSLATTLERSDLEYILERVTDRHQFDTILTDRQDEVLETALEQGYYDSPRRCTQEELADHLDLAKSTCSELLHRAEERVLKRFEAEPLEEATTKRSA